jgi:hypothetical protein
LWPSGLWPRAGSNLASYSVGLVFKSWTLLRLFWCFSGLSSAPPRKYRDSTLKSPETKNILNQESSSGWDLNPGAHEYEVEVIDIHLTLTFIVCVKYESMSKAPFVVRHHQVMIWIVTSFYFQLTVGTEIIYRGSRCSQRTLSLNVTYWKYDVPQDIWKKHSLRCINFPNCHGTILLWVTVIVFSLLLELLLVKDEGEGFLVPKKNITKVHNRCGGSAPRILDLDIRWRWVVTSSSQTIFLLGMHSRY